ncbi:glycerate kinase [Lutispora thermophila]|uniref:Glycerate kinase n=1 Tax=Lutispora thermophila DSM 19022 TaxID=1122184 RepID=A0A1M6EDK6_9FIRM|nr:glycerate kinase [Lutispora thermophila]SHI83555.1 glycerate kinase [Lutispora thermophila DSM 19022]
MKVVIAPDSFKGSLSSRQVCVAIGKGIKRADPSVEIVAIPMADGGEGTVDALMDSLGGHKVIAEVKDPLFRDIKAQYGLADKDETAVIEMAAASGLALLSDMERNPMKTTTYGTGQLIKDALDRGCRNFIIGIGGSATNDGGIGMAAALGAKFYDWDGNAIELNGGGLLKLDAIDLSQLDPRVAESRFRVFCDVDNILYGSTGAAYVYGRQKGADDAMIEKLDMALKRLSEIIERDLNKSVALVPGAGAAGGLGAGLLAFLDAKLEKGIDILMETIGFEERIKGANLIITGEGRMDHQTKYGKTISGIIEAAKKQGIPVVGICGSIGDGVEELYSEGLNSVFSIINRPMSLEESMVETSELLTSTAQNVMSLFMANVSQP